MTATPSQEWTPNDETALFWYAARLNDGDLANADAALFARKILSQRDEVARLRAENERLRHSSARRWNIEEDDETGVLLVCKNHHAKSEGCHFEEYVPRSQLAATREGETPT